MDTVDFTLGNNFLPYTCFKYGLHDKAEPIGNTQDVNLTGSIYCWEARCAYHSSLCNTQMPRHISIISCTYEFTICWQQADSFLGDITFT